MTAAPRPTETKDLAALAQFLIRIYKFDPSDHHADLDLLEWKYLREQPEGEGNRSYLLEKNGQIIAHCGICPVALHLPNGIAVNSVTMMDWAADPSAPGIGIRLFRHLMELAPTSFVIGGAPPTRMIIPPPRLSTGGQCRDLQRVAATLARISDASDNRKIDAAITARTYTSRAPRRDRARLDNEWACVQVSQFDDSIVPMLANTERTWTFCQRTLAGLNHLLLCPRPKMQGFLLKRRGDLVGYFVIGMVDWEARLLDLEVDSGDAEDWTIACALATEAARLSPEVCRIRALANFPILRRALGSNGYWQQYEEPIMLYDPSHLLDRAFPVSFQFFDGDSGY